MITLRVSWSNKPYVAGCRLLLGCALAALMNSGCRAPGDLDSPNPYERARAVVASAESDGGRVTHRLVNLLSDEDPAVRMYAILALERLTGRTYEYQYWESPAQRQRAIHRWRNALQAGEVRLKDDGAAASDLPAVRGPRQTRVSEGFQPCCG